MKAQDIIRAVLELIDQDEQKDTELEVAYQDDEPTSRFKQIVAMLSNPTSPEAMEPNGSLNGPKHPADIRVKDSGYGHGS
jgi:hypothetical protein